MGLLEIALKVEKWAAAEGKRVESWAEAEGKKVAADAEALAKKEIAVLEAKLKKDLEELALKATSEGITLAADLESALEAAHTGLAADLNPLALATPAPAPEMAAPPTS